jgi:hypothetical protein
MNNKVHITQNDAHANEAQTSQATSVQRRTLQRRTTRFGAGRALILQYSSAAPHFEHEGRGTATLPATNG